MKWPSILSLAALLGSVAAVDVDHGRLGNMQRARIARHAEMNAGRAPHVKRDADTSKFRFLTDDTKEFQVESLPDVDYDIGEMYSGLIPVHRNKSRALFFVFQPTVGAPVDEVTIWLNGGPGCSSLEGFFQENGLFRWGWGVYKPLLNPYSWVNLTNMLWVEQPVGTGFSIGEIRAKNEHDVAHDFNSWFLNFQKKFGIKNFKIYLTGESYAGRYVPYISAAMINRNDTENFDVHGALVYDPCIGDCGTVQINTVAVPFIEANANLFNFNQSYMSQLAATHESCGYAAYIDKYLRFPPAGIQPAKVSPGHGCDVSDDTELPALHVNPCFNPYEMTTMCPLPYDVLGFPTILEYEPAPSNYFDRPDVKKAMHAPMDVAWSECSNQNVFPHGDASEDPILKVLPKVIEHTNRVLVANGDYDFVVITNGTLLSIQNMTWNGKLGFQQAPSTPIDITLPELEYLSVFQNNIGQPLGSQGVMGVQHQERGLMFARTYQSGHMQPQFQTRVSYRHLQWVLGRINAL